MAVRCAGGSLFGPWGANPSDDNDADQAWSEDSAWRGSLHFDNWPEELAGPEYWLNKEDLDDDDDDDDS